MALFLNESMSLLLSPQWEPIPGIEIICSSSSSPAKNYHVCVTVLIACDDRLSVFARIE
jgi:hypothetical protein